MAATLAPNSWTANTTRPPRTWVKYARSAATSRLGVYRKSSCWKGAAWSAMHGTGPRRVLERGLPLWARAGTGGRANNPVHQLGHREGPAGLVLQRGQPNVLAWITELQGNLEHPGEQLMPLGPGLHPHSAKPAEASVWAQSMPIRGGSRGSTGSLGCQLVSTSRPPGRSSRHASRADAVGVSGKMQRVNGDHGVGRAIGQAGSGQVADDEPGPLGQPEQHRPVGRLLDGNGREVHPGSAGRRAPGPTTAQDRPGRSPGRPVSSQARGRERRPHDPAGRPRQRSTARSLVAGRGWRPARLAAGPRIRPRWRTPGRTRRPWPMAAGRRRSSGRAGPGSPILLTAVRSEIRVGLPWQTACHASLSSDDPSTRHGRPPDIWWLRTNPANAWLTHHQQDRDAS